MAPARLLISLSLALLVVFRAASLELPADANYGIGSPDVFLSKYAAYRARQLKNTNPDVLRIRLGYVKGLSRSFTAMAGELALDLASGKFSVSLNRLTTGQIYSVWLVDDKEGDGIWLAGDTVFRLATVNALTSSTLLAGELGLGLPPGFLIDRVVVAPGDLWNGDVLAAGSVNVFQKMFFRRVNLTNESRGVLAFAESTPAPSFSALVPDLAAETEAARLVTTAGVSNPLASALALFLPPLESTLLAQSGSSVPLDVLISQGAKAFFEKTFAGNGRTCGTCHPASNNFTIDVAFIGTLPPNDPLFVAEFNPALAQLERSVLMRNFGLILENVDGLEDPTNKFVMRGVPHTLGLSVSLETDTSQPNPPAEMTGWSGDGAPGTGSLREFALGAVTQHFTKSLERIEGRDFNLPSNHDLDAMEAFQLSLGRDADFDLSKITFLDATVDEGKSLFVNGTGNPDAAGRCVACHGNAGALAANSQNRNFNTNVEDVVHPARSFENFPPDGGFGRTANLDGTFGNRAFNTASAVEAADTAPFFHNNVVSTLEGVVSFYSGPQFNNPSRPAAARFSFDTTQINEIADFMRAANTLQNIDVAERELEEILALSGNLQKEVQTRLQTALSETDDAIAVLNQGGIFPAAVTELTEARNLIVQAQGTSDPNARRVVVQQAIAELRDTRDAVATIAP